VLPVLSDGTNSRAAANATPDVPQDAFTTQRLEVLALASAGKLPEALAALRDAMRASSSVRENFRRSILMGSLLLKGKQPLVAIPVLESLNETIEEYHLERWDPDLALEALVELLQAYRQARQAAPQQTQLAEKQQALLGRISRIDPSRAFELGS
jgi:type VI secretion system protein VasJ